MGEIRIKNVPEELWDWLHGEAERKGVSVGAFLLMELWWTKEGRKGDLGRDQLGTQLKALGTNQSLKGDQLVPAAKLEKLEKTNAEREGRFLLPGWVPREAWGHYEEMRRKMRKPMTETAKKLAVGELGKLREQGEDPEKVLEQSVYKCWQGLFPVNGGSGGGSGYGGRKTVTEHNREAFREAARLRGDPAPEDEQ